MSSRQMPEIKPYNGRIDPVDGKYHVSKQVTVLMWSPTLHHYTTFIGMIELMWTEKWALIKAPLFPREWILTSILDQWN
jgi:hypothetical protein